MGLNDGGLIAVPSNSSDEAAGIVGVVSNSSDDTSSCQHAAQTSVPPAAELAHRSNGWNVNTQGKGSERLARFQQRAADAVSMNHVLRPDAGTQNVEVEKSSGTLGNL